MHDSLMNHYKTNFALMQHHKYSLTELDNMIPYEREIYVTLLKDHIERENERYAEQERRMKMKQGDKMADNNATDNSRNEVEIDLDK